MAFPTHSVAVLIEMKRLSVRLKDQSDLEALEASDHET